MVATHRHRTSESVTVHVAIILRIRSTTHSWMRRDTYDWVSEIILWNHRLPCSLRTQTYFLSSLLSSREYSDDRKYAFVRRLQIADTDGALPRGTRRGIYYIVMTFHFLISLSYRDFRTTTKGNTNPDLLYGLDFVLIHMDCSTVIVLMFAHKVSLLFDAL